MADVNELTGANKFVYAKAHGNATIAARVATRLYEDGNQPESGPYPLIVWSWISERDSEGLGECRLLANPVLQIKLITKGKPTADDNTVANTLDDVFQHISTEVFEGYVYTSRRRIPLRFPERSKNSSEVFFHLGGQYRMHIHPVS